MTKEKKGQRNLAGILKDYTLEINPLLNNHFWKTSTVSDFDPRILTKETFQMTMEKLNMIEKPTISFQNEGLIDLRAITTIGVSVKEKEGSIGMFGSGCKYAIAVLLRENQKISIFRGKEEFKFTTKVEEIRGEPQNIIYMNDTPLGFTTHFGMNWTLKEAYRELASNTMDENGDIIRKEVEPKENTTTIVVQGKKFADAAMLHGEIFLDITQEPLLEDENIQIFKKDGMHKGIYYRGIQVFDLKDFQGKFIYNLKTKNTELTEDRTLKHLSTAEYYAAHLWIKCKDEDLAHEWLDSDKESFEGSMTFYGVFHTGISDVILDAVRERSKDKGAFINLHLFEKCSEADKSLGNIETREPNDFEMKMIEKGIKFAKKANMNVDKYPIKVATTLGKGILGLAQNKTIYLSAEIFTKGTSEVAKGLIEEWMHLEYKCNDCTREMQNILLDRWISDLEQYCWGEPL